MVIPQICIKVILPSQQSETTLDFATHAINVSFLRHFLLAGQSTSAQIALIEIMLPKTNRRGVGIRISWVENFEKLINGGTSTRHPIEFISDDVIKNILRIHIF